DLVLAALTARLPDAVEHGLAMIERRAAQTSDCGELLAALPPLADTVRYGEARPIDAAQLASLLSRILMQGALALPYAVRGLDALFGRTSAGLPGRALAPDAAAIWPAHLERLTAILTSRPADD